MLNEHYQLDSRDIKTIKTAPLTFRSLVGNIHKKDAMEKERVRMKAKHDESIKEIHIHCHGSTKEWIQERIPSRESASAES